jgi:biopolymer transport protein ExbD
LERNLQRLARASSKPTITISPDKGAPTEFVVAVMDIAMRFEINAVLATEGD